MRSVAAGRDQQNKQVCCYHEGRYKVDNTHIGHISLIRAFCPTRLKIAFAKESGIWVKACLLGRMENLSGLQPSRTGFGPPGWCHMFDHWISQSFIIERVIGVMGSAGDFCPASQICPKVLIASRSKAGPTAAGRVASLIRQEKMAACGL